MEHTEKCIDYNQKYESDTPGVCICEDIEDLQFKHKVAAKKFLNK